MRKRRMVAAMAALMCAASGIADDYETDRELLLTKCTRCHEIGYHLYERSAKSWELTIARMRSYEYDETVITAADGKRLARFLAEYARDSDLFGPDGERRPIPDPYAHLYAEAVANTPAAGAAATGPAGSGTSTTDAEPRGEPVNLVLTPPPVAPGRPSAPPLEPSPTAPAATGGGWGAVEEEPPPAVEAVAAAARPVTARPPRIRPPVRWASPGARAALRAAKLSGYLAVICLAGVIGTGLARRRLRIRFRPLHRRFGAGLAVSLAAHGLILVARHGVPNVLWYWFGITAVAALLMTQIQDVLRRRKIVVALRVHQAAAAVGVTLTVLHWVWAWL